MVKVSKVEYFPRGSAPISGTNAGAVVKKKLKQQKISNIFSEKNEHDDLFVDERVEKTKSSLTATGVSGGKQKKRNKNRLNTEENELLAGINGNGVDKFNFDVVSYDTICEDFLLLGRVSKAKNDKLVVNLPNRVVGEISITGVSRPYTRIMEIVASGVEVDSPWYMLPQMFSEGQLISVKVKEVQDTATGKKIFLTSDPASLHSNYNSTSIKKGMIFTAAVESIEDHGYIMDLGINGTRAFLDSENAIKFIKHANAGRPLGLGQLVECQVLTAKVTNNLCNVKLSADPKAVHKYRYPDDMELNYSLLLPGMLMEGIVMETYKGGLKVHVMELEGLIHKDHLKDTWGSPLKHEISSKVMARVLYIFPNGTNPYLSLQINKLYPHHVLVNESSVKLGGNEKVKIVRTDKSGIIVRFSGGEKGIVSLRRCSDDSSWTAEDVKKHFPKGSSHECKVLDYNSMDGMYIGSFQKSMISQGVVRIEQVEPGNVVNCTIKRWTPIGAVVNFGMIHGLIPYFHFGNIPLRFPAQKFPPGATVRAKVIQVDMSTSKIVLTAKKELIKDKSLFATYEDIQKGNVAKGFVVSTNRGGVIVGIIGGLKGFIPLKHLGVDPGLDFQQLFFLGRLVTFQVVHVQPEAKKLILSLLIKDELTTEIKKPGNQKENKKGKKRQEEQIDSEDETADEELDSPPKKKQKKNKKASDNKEAETTPAPVERANEVESDDESISQQTGMEATEKTEGTVDEAGNLNIPAVSFWDVDGEGDAKLDEITPLDDFATNDNGINAKKLTRKEKRKLKEEKIRETELALADNSGGIKSEDDCERLILASPNSSLCWIQFMAFYVEKGEIAKAKEVGMRGLKTILFREEQERLNVWVALLNLENNYGTPESLNAVLQEAVRNNDDFKVLSTMAEIYCQSKKLVEAEDIFKRLLKKFRENPDPYIKYGKFLYMGKRLEDGRDLFKKSLLNLNRAHHVQLISKYCQFELEFGERERGCTMFDQLLGTYPKRIDVWLVYANALAKISDFDGAKSVLIRAIGTKFPPKKTKPIFTRLFEIDLQSPNSDPDAIRQLALEYTESLQSQPQNNGS